MQAQQLPADAGHFGARGIVADGNDFELRGRAFRHAIAVPLRADADARSVERDRQRQLALYGAAGGIRHAQHDLPLQQPRRLWHVGKGDGHRRVAAIVGLRRIVDRLDDALHGVVVPAELVAGIGGEIVHGRYGDVAGDRETGRGRAVEIAGGDIDGVRPGEVEGVVRGGDGEIEPLGNEVLDEERLLLDRRAVRIGVEAERPRPAHGVGAQREVEEITAEALIGEKLAAVLDAVRPPDHHRQRQVGDGIGDVVADERGGVDRLAGPINAALGAQIRVDRAGRLASFDAAVSEIEGGPRKIEEGVVAVIGLGNDKLRRLSAGAADEARIEMRIAVGVGVGGCQHFIVAGDEAEMNAFHRLGRMERSDDGVQAVIGGERRQAEIGDDEPLRRLRRPIVLLLAWQPGRDDVHAGLLIAERFGDRDRRRHHLIRRGVDVDFAGPDALAVIVGDVGGAIRLELVEEDALTQREGEAAVADAVDLRVHRRRIDRLDRDGRVRPGRQDIGVGAKADPRRPIRHENVDDGGIGQDLAVERRQAGANLDAIAVAVDDAVDADLVRLRLDGEAVAFDGDEIGKAGLRHRQRIGEDDADARIVRRRIDLMADDAEAVLGDKLIEVGLHGGVGNELQRGAIGLDRRAPDLALLQAHCRA